MIISFSYSEFPISDNSSHPCFFGWLYFIGLAPVLYILHYFLHNEATQLEFTYKAIDMTLTVNNIHMQLTVIKFLR